MGVCATPASRSTSLPTKARARRRQTLDGRTERTYLNARGDYRVEARFFHRSDIPTRHQLDAKDYKPFWVRAAELFNDPNFMPSLVPSPGGRDLQMSAVPSGHQMDANTLET